MKIAKSFLFKVVVRLIPVRMSQLAYLSLILVDGGLRNLRRTGGVSVPNEAVQIHENRLSYGSRVSGDLTMLLSRRDKIS